MVNKSTTVNSFVLHTLQRNITHLAVITRKTYIKFGILKRERNWKRAVFLLGWGSYDGNDFYLNLSIYTILKCE